MRATFHSHPAVNCGKLKRGRIVSALFFEVKITSSQSALDPRKGLKEQPLTLGSMYAAGRTSIGRAHNAKESAVFSRISAPAESTQSGF